MGFEGSLQLAIDNTIALFTTSIIATTGNDGADACRASPSSSAYVGTVGATQIGDNIAPYNNTGKCNTLYAPGTQAYCTNIASTYQRVTSTSMAFPIVCGVMAQYVEYNSVTTYDITNTLYRSRTRGNVKTGRGDRPAPLVHIPTQYDLLLLTRTLVDMYDAYI